MKYSLMLTVTLIIVYFANGCSDASSPSKDANVVIVSEMSGFMVNGIDRSLNGSKVLADEVDSIKVVNIRILISEMKLFTDTEDTANGRMMKTGPFVFNVDASGKMIQIVSGSVPPANYDKIKFEFHRFSSNELNQYANDAIFKDFATSDRYSVIINGIAYKNNVPTIFTFNAQTTANLLLKFNPVLNLTEGSNTTLSIQVDPKLFFKKGTAIIDPREPKNANDIENAIKNTIKAIKK